MSSLMKFCGPEVLTFVRSSILRRESLNEAHLCTVLKSVWMSTDTNHHSFLTSSSTKTVVIKTKVQQSIATAITCILYPYINLPPFHLRLSRFPRTTHAPVTRTHVSQT